MHMLFITNSSVVDDLLGVVHLYVEINSYNSHGVLAQGWVHWQKPVIAYFFQSKGLRARQMKTYFTAQTAVGSDSINKLTFALC